MVIGIGGTSTGNGVFTLHDIPEGVWITSYAPTAPIRHGRHHPQTDYILTTTYDGKEIEVDGQLCPLAIGAKIQDGSFPFVLVADRFSRLIRNRVNCHWAIRDGEIWFKSNRSIKAGEELLTRYSLNNSYWTIQFTQRQLQLLQQALLEAEPELEAAENVIRNFTF